MMQKSSSQYRRQFENLVGQYQRIEKDLEKLNNDLEKSTKELEYSEEARIVIQTVAQQTQKELEYRISELASLALRSVFDDPYEMQLKFETGRGKTEARIVLTRDGNEIDPMTEAGGGVVDVVSFALRVSLWTLKNPRSRNVIIMDEPFRFLSRDLHDRASEMLKEVSTKLNLQFIVVSHSPELIEGADKIFEVTMRDGVTKVRE